MSKVLIYSKVTCAYCVSAKRLLDNKKISYEEIMVDSKPPEFYINLKQKTGWMTVPQIFINEKFIGGYAELKALDNRGELDQLLAQKL